jgi:predicted nucleotidyltransferase
MAQGNYRDYLKGDVVWLKKYLYALRPLLAVRWLEQKRGVVPMEFACLLKTIDDQRDLVLQIEMLLSRKMAGDELDRGQAIPAITRFISDELTRFEHFAPPQNTQNDGLDSLNVLSRKMLERAWGTA